MVKFTGGRQTKNDSRIGRDILMLGLGAGFCFVVMFLIGQAPSSSSSEYTAGTIMDIASSTTMTADSSSSLSTASTAAAAAQPPPLSPLPPPSELPPGFGPIYSYYGLFNHISDSIPTRWWLSTSPEHAANTQGDWFGQHGQDVAVAKFFNFKRDGYFVDLAANDAVWASNTFALEQNFNWSGICIEPNPIYWYRLSFRRCHKVGAIVGGTTNTEVQVQLGSKHYGPTGGIVGKDFDNKKSKSTEKRYTISLETLLQTFNAPTVIDYLSLDVEGAELYIMKDFPFHKYQFKVMTVERPKPELISILEQNGYQKVLDIKRGDTMWAHSSVYEQGKQNVNVNQKEIHKHKVEHIPGIISATS